MTETSNSGAAQSTLFSHASQTDARGAKFYIAGGNLTVGQERNSQRNQEPVSVFDILEQMEAKNVSYTRLAPASTCDEGSRDELIKDIECWLDDPSRTPIFWINGPAGVGKSCIAQTIAEKLGKEGRLAASFFFDWQSPVKAEQLIPTISLQLYQFNEKLPPDPIQIFRTDLSDPVRVTKNVLNICRSGFEHQAELIFAPMRATHLWAHYHKHNIVVIDALDECKNFAGKELNKDNDKGARNDAMKKLVKTISSIAITLCGEGFTSLRFLVTSRNEKYITNSFRSLDGPFDSKFLREEDSSIAVQKYLARALSNSQIKPDVLKQFIDAAGGLFTYAVIIKRFLENTTDYSAAIEMFKRDGSDKDILGTLYGRILSEAKYEKDPTRITVNTIILLFDRLSLPALRILLKGVLIDQALNELHSVFVIPEDPNGPIRFHATLREHVDRLHTAAEAVHTKIATRCLQLMTASDTPLDEGATAREAILRYAFRYWAGHLVKSAASDEIIKALNKFVTHFRFIQWKDQSTAEVEGMANISSIFKVLVKCREVLEKGDPTSCKEALDEIRKIEGPVIRHFFSPRRRD